MAEESAYEEMISALQDFRKDAAEQCQIMTSAGADCVDNTEDDEAATRCKERLDACVGKVEEELGEIDRIIAALQWELDQMREAARRANGE